MIANKDTLFIEANNVGDAWIKALVEVFFEGVRVKTDYDSADDELSFDVSSAIVIRNPITKDMDLTKFKAWREILHPADLYGFMSLRSHYLKEMTGEFDNRIWEDTKSFPYTYHDRFFAWRPWNTEDRDKAATPPYDFKDSSFPRVDQMEYIIKELTRAPHSRRAQGISWKPYSDPYRTEPPCLQRIWCRIFDGKLYMNTHWRSRDLFKAWGSNVVGVLMWMKEIAVALGVEVGVYRDFCDSLHIYGKLKVIKEVLKVFEILDKKEGLRENYRAELYSHLAKFDKLGVE